MYGDYRTAMEESEPRLYEDIVDFEAAKALFQEVGTQTDGQRGTRYFIVIIAQPRTDQNPGCIRTLFQEV